MNHNPNHPSNEPIEAWQLTAYALSELDAADANRVEQALERDSDLRSEYEQIQQTLGAVRSVLSPSNSVIALDEKQSDLVAQGIARSATLNPTIAPGTNATVRLADRPFYRRKRFAALLATAALIPLTVSYWPSLFTKRSEMAGVLFKSADDRALIFMSADDTQFTQGLATSKRVSPQAIDEMLESQTKELASKRNRLTAEQDKLQAVLQTKPYDRPLSLGRTSNAVGTDVLSQANAGSGSGLGGYVSGGGGILTSGAAAPGGTAPEHIAIADVATLAEGKSSDEQKLPAELRQNAPDAFRQQPIEKLTSDRFEKIIETPFVATEQAPLSTFSIDVDTASYSKIRQYLNQSNLMPNPNMVRIEEMINYFEYDYSGPKDDTPFAAHMAVAQCPWNLEHRLVRIGLQARKIDMKQRPKANIVFLLDVSGSMNQPNKLPLVKKSLSLLASQLTENDNVAIVVYAGAAGCVLPSTNGANKQAILSSLEHLNAGGSTNGGQGIQLAYSIAKEHFIEGGVNRVILCTDGDFNVGVTGDSALVEMMQANAKSNIFLTCLGFGMGNYNDTMMEKISNQGNGIYGMIDNEIEARRMMVEQLAGTLVTVAKDVKIQVDFNPNKVAGYRLIGYEDRRLANKDFDNDQKDAGEIGAGHRVTALYEVIPAGKSIDATPRNDGEASKYQQKPKAEPKPVDPVVGSEFASELLTLKVRYKQPEGSVSTKQEFVLNESDRDEQPQVVDRDIQWATAVAEFGLLLRQSKMAPNADWSRMLERAEMATQGDAYRLECVQMMRKARSLSGIDSRQK
ncbi:MAG: von Willebrand factor type A domain-containing protein [Pirellula sp.]|nr:von Willebrand factor type A domain-containing protein [Pirellula sp.]